DRRLEERALDALPTPRPVPLVERGENALDGPHARPQVAGGEADRGRGAVGLPRAVHDPGHPLGDEVEAASLTVGPIRSEAGELGVDEARILAREDVVAEPGPFHDRGAVVLDEDVHQGDEAEEDGPPGPALVVEGEAPLVP